MKELQKKFESFRDIDKKMARLFKDFDVNLMTKQLKGKAEHEDVMKDFAIMDTKINTNSDNVVFLRKDVDNLVLLYRKLIQSLQQGGGGMTESPSLLTTKKLHPIASFNCLSCGH